ncbi:MAG: hypothetical protein ACU826_05450 [Gammaproteobacteria bacterium]
MTALLLSVLSLQCLGIIGWGLIQRKRMVQFPFLAAGVFLGWIVPQLLGLRHNPFLPAGALDKTIIMAIMCLGASFFGYKLNKIHAKLFWWRFDRQRLLLGSMLLSLIGAFFFYQISLLAPSVTAEMGGQWTGIITVYVFFSRMLTFGLAIALILHFLRPSWPSLIVILFDLVFYLDRIVIKGRRAAMIELGLMFVMALWFNRRWLPSRTFMVITIVIGALVINSIGDYRKIMLGEDRTTWSGAGLDDILKIDFIGNLARLANGEADSHELKNAALNIEAVDRQLRFDYGLSHWNNLVFAYVPGQWVGYEVKQSLMFDLGNPAYDEFNFIGNVGSTSTGLTDAFQSFWYFGAVKFFLIGLIMSRWYQAALKKNLVAQMVLMLVISGALHAITHSTHSFFTVFVSLAVFLIPLLAWSRVNAIRAPLRETYTYDAIKIKNANSIE